LEYLDYLEKHQGLHRQAYQLKLRALQRAGQWARINETLEMMQRRGFIESVAATHLERVAAVHRVRECEAYPKSLQALWNGLPETLQQHPDLLREYLERAESINEFDGIAWLFKAVERSLDQQWDDALWMAYALHPAQSPQHALSYAENWLTQYPTNTQLLYGLGIICQHMKLWGKARSYLEAAQSIHSDRTITYALINLFQAEGRPEEAQTLLLKTVENELEAATLKTA
jgi:HemY protein